ncbi:MAG: efflux transporter permease subunit, partial [Hyphomicrobiales bacterium]|nr:efflux transporter permease subunit [Hyphomicrobiales bacterium]
DAVASIRSGFPVGTDDPIVQRETIRGDAIRTYAVTQEHTNGIDTSWLLDNEVIGVLQGLPGVGRVQRVGGFTREMRVDLDPDRLMALGITASQVNTQLKAVNGDFAGGTMHLQNQQQSIRFLASSKSVADLAGLRLSIPGNRSVQLSELGTVRDTWEDPTTFARFDGRPTVALAVYPTIGANDVAISAELSKALSRVEADHPGLSFAAADDTVAYTQGNYQDAMNTLYEGAALAVVVVFLFLRNLRATIIACVALPLSAIPTFWALSLMGYSLNLVTLLALTLSTGMLVDDSIVEIENIFRHIRMGKAPFAAAADAANEIGLTVVAISFAVIAIFAPVSFMPGVAGQYFREFGVTVSVAVFFSLAVARLITPMLSAYLMRQGGHDPVDGAGEDLEAESKGIIGRSFAALLTLTFKPGVRWLVLLAAIGSLGLALFAATGLPTDFIPLADESRIMVSVQLPPGSTLNDTSATARRIETALHTVPEVAKVLVKGGTSLEGIDEPRRAILVLTLLPKDQRHVSQIDTQAKVGAALSLVPDIRYSFDGQATIAIGGRDEASVTKGADQLVSEMQHDPMFADAIAVATFAEPEVHIVPKLDEASSFGVSPAQIADTSRVAEGGESPANLASFDAGDRHVPIRVELQPAARGDLKLLGSLQIPTANGGAVPLSQVADITRGQGVSAIQRYDRERLATIAFDPAPGIAVSDATDHIAKMKAVVGFSAGVDLQNTGNTELQGEMFSGFGTAMGFGILGVYILLIVLFRSAFQPLTILAALPLSLGGVVLALVITGYAFSLPVIIGLLMLMGLVTKNSIMLVEFAIHLIRSGIPRRVAVAQAAQMRARPIMMTTIAMVAGMTPALLGVGAGGEFRAPMAAAVVGGLVASTLLSLLVVPSLFTIVDDLAELSAKLFLWVLRPNATEPSATLEEVV